MHIIGRKSVYRILPIALTIMLLLCGGLLQPLESAVAADSSASPIVSALQMAPALAADNSLNVINKPVELTFADDMIWRENINSVTVDGVALDSEKYSISNDRITIDKSMFRTSKEYVIVVKADGYADTEVTQTVGLICIMGDGVMQETVFTLAELEAMQQEKVLYSATNDFPADFPVVAQGIPLQALLDYAGMKPSAELLSFKATDGFWADFTVDELLNQKRYIFPDKTEVGVLIALERMERSTDFAEMDTADTPVLCLGQRAATEQTVLTFVKLLQIITVTSEPLQRWEQPTARIIDPVSGQKIEMPGGEVPEGAQIVLKGNAKTKIYYTTDGSEPDIDSEMHNLHGCGPMAGQDEPIVIEADTTIKAKAIWPGKLDSETAVFAFTVEEELVSTAMSEIPVGEFTTDEGLESLESSVFCDIQDCWAKEDIEFLANRGLITGKSSDSYEPESKITRAEFAVLLVRALGLQEKVLQEGQFADVASTDWCAGSIAAAAAQNIITGYDGQVFKPDNSITREEMAVMMARAGRVAGKDDELSEVEQEQQLAQFQDRDQILSWGRNEAALAVKNGIIKGTAAGVFAPQSYADRAQSAAILKRFLTYADLMVN